MLIRLKRVRGSNALTYGDFDFTLDEHTVYQLIGKNGSGKSSLPIIIEEILYNNNSRGLTKGELLHRYSGIKSWWGEVTFDIEGDVYVVHKEVKSTTKVKLSKNGEDISGHTSTQTYALIRELFGDLEFKTFSKLVYQSMDSSLDFLTATDATRKKFLVSLLGLEEYSEIEESLKNVRKDTSALVDKLTGKVTTLRKWLDKHSAIPDHEQLIEVPEFDPSFGNELDELRVQLRTSELNNKAIDDNAKAIQAYEDAISRRKIAEDAVLQLRSSKPAPAEDLQPEIQKVTRELATIQANMDAEKKTYQKFRDSAEKTTCHTCGHELDISELVTARDAAKERFMAIKPERDEKQALLAELEEKQKEFKIYDAWERKLALAENKLAVIKEPEVPEFLDKQKTDVISLQAQIRQVTEKLNKHKSDIDFAIEQNTSAQINNAKRENILSQLSEYRAELDPILVELEAAESELADITILCEAFGAKGLIGYKIESSVKVFEESINKYLEIFTSGQFAIGFELDATKLKVVIYDDGLEANMRALSSGERSKVTVSTLLAIRSLMSALSNVHINLLFLDEVISVLDSDASDTLIELLLNETHINTFLVSHGYNHPLTKDIRIEKRNKISTVVNG